MREAIWSKLKPAVGSGDLLERVTCAVLRDHGFLEVQRQLAGTQFGFDIYAQLPTERGREVWKIECKNLARPLTIADLAPKLVWHLGRTVIDHFLVVATSPLANDARLLLERNPFGFPITVWTEETFAKLVAESPSACSMLALEPDMTLAAEPNESLLFLPHGQLQFDVVHQHSPPRQFAYFRDRGGLVKAFTEVDFKLLLIFTSRADQPLVVTDVVCTTRAYRELSSERLVVQTKPKGLFQPETTMFVPSRMPGGEAHLLGGAVLGVAPGAVEVLRAELDEHSAPGVYEIEFHATTSDGKRLSTPVMWLVVNDSSRRDCNLVVYGKHYDRAASQLLDVSADAWELLTRDAPDKVRILGPTLTEIAKGLPPPTQWQVREVRVDNANDGTSSFHDESAHHLLTLEGVIDDELYRAGDYVVGRYEEREVSLDEQLLRRWLLVGN